MRWNRGTLILVAALLVVIVAVLVINNNQASAPGVTPTAAVATGPLLPNVAGANIVRYEVRDNSSGDFVAVTKDSGGAWHLDATNTLAGRDPDQGLINTTAGQIVSINYTNTFQDSQLATFGLDAPKYSVLVTTNDGKQYTVYIGSKSPTSANYYAVVQQGAVAQATAEATTEAKPVNTPAPSSKPALQSATAEPTAEVTIVSAAVAGQNANESGVLPSTAEATVESTPNVLPPTLEVTAEATAEATANVIHNPQVTLTGQQTIYLIPQTVIDTLTKWLTTPPYAPLPTPAPTSAAVTPEASAESTGEAIGVQGTIQPTPLLEQGANPQLIPAGTPVAIQGATQEATAEATAAQ